MRVLNLISSENLLFLEKNPYLGTLFCSGICPPSKPARTPPPDLEPCPLCPLPLVFPRPLPGPLPLLFRLLVLEERLFCGIKLFNFKVYNFIISLIIFYSLTSSKCFALLIIPLFWSVSFTKTTCPNLDNPKPLMEFL